MSTLIVGCGYLGTRVARLLIQEGAGDVIGTTRSATGAARLDTLGIRPFRADVLDRTSWNALPQVERIVYSVGYDRSAGVPMRQVYIDGLRWFLHHLGSTAWSGRFVYASSTGVYGQTGGEWVDESSPTIPRHSSGEVCLEAEGLLRDAPGRVTTIRFAGLYGPARVVRRDAIERGTPIAGDPERWLNLIHIEDAARAVVTALHGEIDHPLLLACDDRPVTRREYYEQVAKYLGAPAPRFLPPEAGSPEAARDESNKRVSNRRLREDGGFDLYYPDITTGLPAALS